MAMITWLATTKNNKDGKRRRGRGSCPGSTSSSSSSDSLWSNEATTSRWIPKCSVVDPQFTRWILECCGVDPQFTIRHQLLHAHWELLGILGILENSKNLGNLKNPPQSYGALIILIILVQSFQPRNTLIKHQLVSLTKRLCR